MSLIFALLLILFFLQEDYYLFQLLSFNDKRVSLKGLSHLMEGIKRTKVSQLTAKPMGALITL